MSRDGEAEPLYPWFYEAIGLERVPAPVPEPPGKRGGKRLGRGGRIASRSRHSGKVQRCATAGS